MIPSDYSRTLVDLWARGAREWIVGQERLLRAFAHSSVVARRTFAGDDDAEPEERAPDCMGLADATRSAIVESAIAAKQRSPFTTAVKSPSTIGAHPRRPILVVPPLLASTAPPVGRLVAGLGRAGALVHVAQDPAWSARSFAGFVRSLHDALDTLDKTSEAGPASVVALGDGGLIALAQAALESNRPRNLVLVDTCVDCFADPEKADRGSALISALARRLTTDDVDRLLDAYGGLPATWLNDLSDNPVAVGCSGDAAAILPRELAGTLLTEIYGENQLIEGCLVVDGRTVDLQAIRGAILALPSAGTSGSPDPSCLALAVCVGSQDFTWRPLASSFAEGHDEAANGIVRWLAERDGAR